METTLAQPGAIVVADDDPDDLELLRLLLRKSGLSDVLEIHRDGEALVGKLTKLLQSSARALRPLLCFLDVDLPKMSGLDVLRWIRAQAPLDRLAVVMLSGSENTADIVQAAQEGAQCYLAKYPQPALLKDVLEEAQRFAEGVPAVDCFRFPHNLLLVRGRRL
jgi:CheY-like chemotaxis protein